MATQRKFKKGDLLDVTITGSAHKRLSHCEFCTVWENPICNNMSVFHGVDVAVLFVFFLV